MKIRSHFFLFLFLFGMAPLLTAVVINLPFVMDKLELFYRESHVQNLRSDFRDLDYHLVSRQEVVRVFAKLMQSDSQVDTNNEIETVGQDKTHYASWVRQILQDKLDIFQVIYLGNDNTVRFWLEREPGSAKWRTSEHSPEIPPDELRKAAMHMVSGSVLVSPIMLHARTSPSDSRRLMTLHMVSPVMAKRGGQQLPDGMVVLNIDVGDMAKSYKDTLWVNSNGSYISHATTETNARSAFKDFPGLSRVFAESKLSLWEGNGEQVIWVPLFETDKSGSVWVGRKVDPSPVSGFKTALTLRVLSIIFILIIVVLLVARWYSKRISGFGHELTDGIGRLLKNEDSVEFDWDGPQELHQLGRNLNRLAKIYASNVQELREHASKLEDSNRYKSEFLANVSHELRTPLNSILLLSKILSDPESDLSLKQAERARVIHEAAVDLRSLIDNILDISRIEAQEVNFNLSQFRISGLIDELIDLMQPQFYERGLELEFEQDADAPEIIISDRDKLGQVLKNFLSNALKFTQEGSIVIRLHKNERDDLDIRPVAISVTDSGIGIPVHKLSLVFGAFKQVDGSTSRRFGGTGLGLSISRNLAELMGGRIVLWSKEGEGSIFTVLLPQELERPGIVAEYIGEQHAAAKQADADEFDTIVRKFEPVCVLIMDSEIQNLLTLTPMLESWGLRVMAAVDADEAMDTLNDARACGLVLMDLMMLGIHGYGTINRIRGERDLRKLPIIAMMSEQSEEHRQEAINSGVDGFIAKPVKAAELQEMLARYLKTTE